MNNKRNINILKTHSTSPSGGTKGKPRGTVKIKVEFFGSLVHVTRSKQNTIAWTETRDTHTRRYSLKKKRGEEWHLKRSIFFHSDNGQMMTPCWNIWAISFIFKALDSVWHAYVWLLLYVSQEQSEKLHQTPINIKSSAYITITWHLSVKVLLSCISTIILHYTRRPKVFNIKYLNKK